MFSSVLRPTRLSSNGRKHQNTSSLKEKHQNGGNIPNKDMWTEFETKLKKIRPNIKDARSMTSLIETCF